MNRRAGALAGLAAAALGLACDGALAAEGASADAAVRISQSVLGRAVSDQRLTRPDGSVLRLSQLRGEPLVVSFVYTSCHEICPGTTVELHRAVGAARQVLRDNTFNVVTIGFDAENDTPRRMQEFARSLGIHDEPRWYFLTADKAAIDTLARELGFTYAPSPRGFDHILQTSVLDTTGRVFGQIYGDRIGPQALIEPLKRIYLGGPITTSPLRFLERVRLLCTVFDPKAGRYRFDYSLIVSILTGALSFAAVAAFVVHAWRGQRHARQS